MLNGIVSVSVEMSVLSLASTSGMEAHNPVVASLEGSLPNQGRPKSEREEVQQAQGILQRNTHTPACVLG